MKEVMVQNKLFIVDDPSKDCILQWGLYVPYSESDNPEMHVILHDYIFWSSRLQNVVVVPRWFTTDLASIPRVARVIVSKSGKSKIPALVHDMLYYLHSNFPKQVTYSRKIADKVLKDFCLYRNMDSKISSLVYLAVRIGGKEAFDSEDSPFLPEHLKEVYIKRYSYINLEPSNGLFNIV